MPGGILPVLLRPFSDIFKDSRSSASGLTSSRMDLNR